MSKHVSLNKRWKEVIFAASGLGPNLLMVLMMAYFSDAVWPKGLTADIGFWSYTGVTTAPIIATALFTVLWFIGRCFDGIVDVPLAALTDSLKNKKGGRFITILISFLPMVISFVLCWIPVFGKTVDLTLAQRIGNTIWIFFWSIIFFASYTLALITFYGSLSEVCKNQTQRARVSAYKSVFDTISYALVYAAIPAVFKAIGIPIWKVALYLSPMMLTILIPYLFRTSEDGGVAKDENVKIGKSIVLTVKSRPFMKWTLVNCISFFGLQMFLVGQNTLISGVMNLGAGWAALLNTCAFAPVPLMLFIFNRLRKKVGLRAVYQSCLLAFGIAIFAFLAGSQYFWGDQLMPKLIIGAAGSVIGSWGIGAFFMMPYLIPTVIASVEEEVTHKNHAAMYFAVQALATSIVGAIASSLIYNVLKDWTRDDPVYGEAFWKLGVSVVPFIVAVLCIAGVFVCFLMPKDYSAKVIYNDLKLTAEKEKAALQKKKENEDAKLNATIERIKGENLTDDEKESLILAYKNKHAFVIEKLHNSIKEKDEIINFKFDEKKSSANEESSFLFDKESYFANIGLWVLTGGIYGAISYFVRLHRAKKLGIKVSGGFTFVYILGAFVPMVSIFTNSKMEKMLVEYINKKDPNFKGNVLLSALTSIPLPCFMNVVDMVEKDRLFNKIVDLNK